MYIGEMLCQIIVELFDFMTIFSDKFFESANYFDVGEFAVLEKHGFTADAVAAFLDGLGLYVGAGSKSRSFVSSS